MENHIQHIEFINQYLNKLFSAKESEIFLNQLKTDSYFKNLYEEHLVFLEGLKRQTLKTEIKSAKQYYTQVKWFKYLGISAVIVVASILAYIFLFGNTAVEPKANPDNNATIISDSIPPKDDSEKKGILKDTFYSTEKEGIKETIVSSEKEKLNLESLKKASQIFVVDSKKDTIIICKEGTKLVVKGNSFVDANNRKVEGKISIAVTEYYKLSDMLLANLSTTSDGEQLETGGMIFIEAKNGDSDLKLAQNSSIDILFPTQNKKENMQLFSGEWKDGIINWSLIKENSKNFKPKTAKKVGSDAIKVLVDEDITVTYSVVQEIPIFLCCENVEKAQQRKCTSEAISNFIKTNFDESIAEGLDVTGKHLITMQFVISNNGEIMDIQVMASHIKLAREGVRVLEAMPKMKPGKQRGKEVSVVYTFPMSFMVGNGLKINNRNPIQLKSRTTSDIKFEEKLKAEDSASITTQEVSNYVLSTSQLGWINCDRFTNRNSRIKYKLKIKNNDGAKINMVFKSLNSILPSHYLEGFDFGYVPKNEDVVIVAIKMKEDKLYLDIIDSKTEANPNLQFNFKEVTIQEMKDKLKKLNTLFE